MKALTSIFKLTRIPLSLAIAFSGLAGYVLCARSAVAGAWTCCIGLFFLSCSASVFNQLQERQWDLLMKRTADRPLPAKRIKPGHAWVIAIVTGIAGAGTLAFGCSPVAALLGLLNLLVYVVVYTPLKRETRYAVFIGALTGAIPPMAGWAAAGGDVSSPYILTIALFMYLWQVPHFMLLLLRFGGEYSGAGFPLLLDPSNGPRSRRIVFLWLAGTSASTLLFPLLQVVSGVVPIAVMLFVNCVAIAVFYWNLFSKSASLNFNAGFRSIYLYQIGIFIVLMGNRFAV
jgi:protoheme IX farnesyltransferase